MPGTKNVAHGEPTPGQDGVAFWSRRWETARKAPDQLPPFEDVGLGSIGAYAEGLALLQMDGDAPRVLQASKDLDAWLSEPAEGLPRPDSWRNVVEMTSTALKSGAPVQRRSSAVQGDRIETRDLLAMPLASRWFTGLVLFYRGQPLASHGVTETVYRFTREGFLMLTPVQSDEDRIVEFRVAAANPGASALLGREARHLIGSSCADVFPGFGDEIVATLSDVLRTGATRQLELDLGSDAHEFHLRVSALALDSLAVLTLTDVTQLRAREAGFRLMFESNPVPMCLVDTQTMRFLDVNTAMVQHYGHAREHLIGAHQATIIHPDERATLEAVEADPSPSYEGTKVWRHVRADGREIAVRPYARRLTIRRRPAALVAFFDVTQSLIAEAELRSTKLFVDTIIENIPSALLVEDVEDGRLLLINRMGETLLGLTRAEALGRHVADPFAINAPPGLSAVERQFHAPGVEPRLLSVKKLDVPDTQGTGRYRLTLAEDVTERRAIEHKIAHMAHHDALTDLPNRLLFADQLKAAIARAVRDGVKAAVFGIDLDSFKSVNDTLGHASGDELLREAAVRLSAELRPGDSVARLGGDEFAVLVADAISDEALSARAERVVAELSRPFDIAGHEVRIGGSVGIAMTPDDGADSDTLLRNADLALYRAKQEGKNTFRFFEPGMNLRLQARRELERDLRQALSQGEFDLHYQPIVDLRTQQVSGCEALLRWRHPERGLVSPAEFIPLAEETGLIGPIGAWALRQACSDACAWPGAMTVAVNVSAVQFRDPQLIATVVSALSNAGLAPERLEIEITESVLLANTEVHVAMLHRLRDLGVKIAMDDFGTGHSSLSYLSTFPFDKIKIDQSFVRDVNTNRHCEAIVRAVIDLGQHLGIITVAEGVETSAQMIHLSERGCRLAQGFLFSRALPTPVLRQWLDASGRRELAAA